VVVAAALLSVGLSGCFNFWDEITRRDRSFGTNCKVVLSSPEEPLKVLRDCQDGDDRAKALARLDEPLERKHKTTKKYVPEWAAGTPTPPPDDATLRHEQDLVVEILTRTAVSDPQPLCRLTAIEKLGHFKDARAAKALESAFYSVDTMPAGDLTTRIQCTALSAMGNCGNPDTAAAHALAHYNQVEATEALLHVMQNKKEDLSLRDCAWVALKDSTGKSLPDEPEQWEAFLHPKDGKAIAKENKGLFNMNIDLVKWIHREPAPAPAPTPVPPALAPASSAPVPAPKTLPPSEPDTPEQPKPILGPLPN
jgi:hypothetical protein